MAARRSLPPALRRLLPWFVGWMAFQAVVVITGFVLGRRRNEGDESSPSIRRVFTYYGLELRPTNPSLSRVRLDMAMAGADVDLTGLPRPANGIDLTAKLMMAGLAIRVPPDWRVWWQFRGVGGIGGDGGVQRTDDEHGADLRVHADVLFGGIGIESGTRAAAG
jgi:hypothetical protein